MGRGVSPGAVPTPGSSRTKVLRLLPSPGSARRRPSRATPAGSRSGRARSRAGAAGARPPAAPRQWRGGPGGGPRRCTRRPCARPDPWQPGPAGSSPAPWPGRFGPGPLSRDRSDPAPAGCRRRGWRSPWAGEPGQLEGQLEVADWAGTMLECGMDPVGVRQQPDPDRAGRQTWSRSTRCGWRHRRHRPCLPPRGAQAMHGLQLPSGRSGPQLSQRSHSPVLLATGTLNSAAGRVGTPRRRPAGEPAGPDRPRAAARQPVEAHRGHARPDAAAARPPSGMDRRQVIRLGPVLVDVRRRSS
jgi:hypothetical protein